VGDPFAFNGIQYVSWRHDEYSSAAAAIAVEELAATGANWAGVLTTWYQYGAKSIAIAPDSSGTPSSEALAAAVDQLHSRGLKVMLKPHVDALNHAWRGTFHPRDTTIWFESYSNFLLDHARLAEELHVEMLCIGTELIQLSRKPHWPALIEKVRAAFSGLLTYAANATHKRDEFLQVSFWHLLDFIGLDAYFPVTHGWQTHIPLIQALSQRVSKPVIFTEIGYRSVAGAAAEPWNWNSSGVPDQLHQADCYRSFFEAWSPHSSWMQGAFWWNWPAVPRSEDETGYSPRNKPAADVLKHEFAQDHVERVETLRKQVQSGEYKVDALALSKAIIRHHLR
jgi:Anti-sigma-28 factor, FlgM